ncbi:Hypothetical predicted protein [Pelobates cultripes]|uniref:Uncharacterized protein n=1 Tax=Pelobates cultripes TaxID=61616 RepID=A0AAD1SAL5_PELCU|nr:Hypothetical predicted protein [Pelobates cultripes]
MDEPNDSKMHLASSTTGEGHPGSVAQNGLADGPLILPFPLYPITDNPELTPQAFTCLTPLTHIQVRHMMKSGKIKPFSDSLDGPHLIFLHGLKYKQIQQFLNSIPQKPNLIDLI